MSPTDVNLVPVRFADVYRAALHRWVNSPAMWVLASVGFLPALLFLIRIIAPGPLAANMPAPPLEFLMVLGAACFAAAVPLAPLVALIVAFRYWRALGRAVAGW